MAVTVTGGAGIDVSAPRRLFELRFDRGLVGDAFNAPYYDVSPDGARFLVVSERPTTEFNVIQNWFAELEQLAPID